MIAEQVKNLLPDVIQNVITIGEPPTDADSCIALVESGGSPENYFSSNRMDVPLLKVAIRDMDFRRGYAYTELCKKILAGYAEAQTLGIVLVGDIIYFGRDSKRRNQWQLTFKIFTNTN